MKRCAWNQLKKRFDSYGRLRSRAVPNFRLKFHICLQNFKVQAAVRRYIGLFQDKCSNTRLRSRKRAHTRDPTTIQFPSTSHTASHSDTVQNWILQEQKSFSLLTCCVFLFAQSGTRVINTLLSHSHMTAAPIYASLLPSARRWQLHEVLTWQSPVQT